jgi:signal peptidase II
VTLKQTLRSWGWLPLVAAAIVALDQWTKGWVEQNVPLGSAWAPFPGLASYFNIVHLTNTGAVFGILQGQGGLFAVIAMVAIVAVLLYVRYLPAENWAVRLCLALQLGGAAGNLVDRIQLGHVTDFLLLSVPVRGRVLEWPAFNVADSSLVVGVILLMIVILRSEETRPAVRQPAPEPVPQPTNER